MHTLLTVAVGIGSLTVPGQVFAQPQFQPPMGPFGQRGWCPWGGGATGDWVALLALIAGAVFFILWIVERRKGGPHPQTGSALEILKSRYARGEIDRREFEEKQRDLL